MSRTRPTQTTVLVTCLVVLTIIVLSTALKFAQPIIAPVVLGLVVAIVAVPGVRTLERMGVPRAASASVALIMVGLVTVFLIAAFGPILMQLLEQVPRIEQEIRW